MAKIGVDTAENKPSIWSSFGFYLVFRLNLFSPHLFSDPAPLCSILPFLPSSPFLSLPPPSLSPPQRSELDITSGKDIQLLL